MLERSPDPAARHRVRALLAGALVATGAVACREPRPPAHPPAAEFLVSAGDSTFWVRSGRGGVHVRRAPLILARVGDRFYELYVADDDRSFYDATFVGQRIYRRDLLTNDSTVVFDDPVVPGLARAYASAHPAEHPLEQDEEGSDSPRTVVTSEAEVVEVIGPYVTIEHHTDIDIDQGEDRHVTRRGVIDLRRGAPASLASIVGDSAARRLAAAGRRAYAVALDSVRRAASVGVSEVHRRAADAIDAFAFDSGSFSLTAEGGLPAVAFLVPGQGERAGGLSLSLPPEPAPLGEWWAAARAALPARADSLGEEWPGRGYDVIARDDGSGERLTLLLRDPARREWPLGPIPSPAQRVWRLDDPAADSLSRHALARAFDESVLYGDEARTASAPRAPRANAPRAMLASAARRRAHRAIAPHAVDVSTRSRAPRRGRSRVRS